MRVQFAVLLAVCVTAPRAGCGWDPLDGRPLVDLVGPTSIGASPAAPSEEAGNQFCEGYKAGTLQGWKDVRGEDSTPVGHVPNAVLDICPLPYCGSETYSHGYARGRPTGVHWTTKYP
jgi:hypothetical protein